MIWIFLMATAAFILGGILAVRPTKAQKLVAEVRERAIKSGLHVKLPVSLRFPEGLEKRRSPFYCKHLTEKKFYQNFYCVYRDGDRVQVSNGDIPTQLKTDIDKVLLSASADIDGFYMGDSLVGFSWHESDNAEIIAELNALIEQVQGLLR